MTRRQSGGALPVSMVVLGWLGAIVACFAVGCSDDAATHPGGDQLVDAGWTRFEDAEFEAALEEFDQAIAQGPGNAEAHTGRGWVLARMGDLPASSGAFESARALSPAPPVDALAGRAVVMFDLPPVDYGATADAVGEVLACDSLYTFSHDVSLNWRDLRLIRALCHFTQSQYTAANREVARLGGIPQDSTSVLFVPNLLEELERLSRRLAGRP